MGYLKAFLEAIAGLFGWLNKRSDLANDPAVKKNKIAQQEQDQADRIESLVRTATSDPDPVKREAAKAELQRLNSE
jgi:hypothetical protein